MPSAGTTFRQFIIIDGQYLDYKCTSDVDEMGSVN
jgi:hypothetical protein